MGESPERAGSGWGLFGPGEVVVRRGFAGTVGGVGARRYVWGGDDSVRGSGRRSEGSGFRAGREYTFPEILVPF